MYAAGLRIRDRDKMGWEKRADAKAIQMAAASEEEFKAARKAATPKRRERLKTYHGLVKVDSMVKHMTRRGLRQWQTLRTNHCIGEGIDRNLKAAKKARKFARREARDARKDTEAVRTEPFGGSRCLGPSWKRPTEANSEQQPAAPPATAAASSCQEER